MTTTSSYGELAESGLMHLSTKQATPSGVRKFESYTLRHGHYCVAYHKPKLYIGCRLACVNAKKT